MIKLIIFNFTLAISIVLILVGFYEETRTTNFIGSTNFIGWFMLSLWSSYVYKKITE